MNEDAGIRRRAGLRSMLARGYDKPGARHIAALCSKYLRAYNNEGNYEMEVNGELDAVLRMVKAAPGVIVDVGANDGSWTESVLARGVTRPVHCFEILPAVFPKLERKLGGHPGVTINQVGLGSADGLVSFYPDPAESVYSSHFAMPDRGTRTAIEVPVTTGDGYVREHGITQIAYLKVDVEGMEMDVLEGFWGTFKDGVVAAVQFEHNQSHVLSRHLLHDFVDFFSGFGFEIYRIFPGRLVPFQYNYVTDEVFTGGNFLAVAAAYAPARRPSRS